jgi:hypothetical protein
VRLNSDTAYGSQPAEEDTFEVIYFTGVGQRFVLASVNADGDGSGDSPAGPGGPTGPDGPGGPGGPGG